VPLFFASPSFIPFVTVESAPISRQKLQSDNTGAKQLDPYDNTFAESCKPFLWLHNFYSCHKRESEKKTTRLNLDLESYKNCGSMTVRA